MYKNKEKRSGEFKEPTKRKKKGKEEREGERKKEEGEGVGRWWLRWPPSYAGGIPVTVVSPERLMLEFFFFFSNTKCVIWIEIGITIL